MEMTNHHFNWGTFSIGIAFVFMSILTLNNPGESLISIIVIFGILAIGKGFYELTIRRHFFKWVGKNYSWIVLLGILDILLGVFLMFNLNIGLSILPYFFSVWFISDSIGNLFINQLIKEINRSYYYFSLIVNILGIILGIVLLFNPLTSALTLVTLVSVYFMMIGMVYVVGAF